MRLKRSWLFGTGILLALLLAAGGYHLFAPRRTPVGQPALIYLTSGKLEKFRRHFNASTDIPRVVALLSPT